LTEHWIILTFLPTHRLPQYIIRTAIDLLAEIYQNLARHYNKSSINIAGGIMIKENTRLVLKELYAYWVYYTKPKKPDQLQVVIFAQGRTGSNLLEDLLCSCHSFYPNGELLSKLRKPFGRKIMSPIRFLLGLSKRKLQNFIFRVKIYQLEKDQRIDAGSFLHCLQEDGWKIIYLRRQNKINHAISNEVANARGGYDKYDDKDENILIDVNLNRFVKRVQWRYANDEAERAALDSLEYFELVYEDDLEREEKHQVTANRIFDYLGLERTEVRTRHKKVNVKTLGETVKNYQELLECIHENNWHEFLQDPEVKDHAKNK
jgi:hypothetical protein